MGRAVNPYEDPDFVDRYARARPGPPRALVPFLTQLSGGRTPRLVVDLGCGTGLSCRAWRGRARRVVGIDSNPEMLRRARPARGVEFRRASARETGLPDGSADVVTCSQSFHWMEPRETIREVARILRRGGIFAAYDYSLPPLIDPELDPAFTVLFRWAGVKAQPEEKARHLANLSRSRQFRWIRDFSLQDYDLGDARRALDLALSVAHVAARLPESRPRTALPWKRFERSVERAFGRGRRRFWWSYETNLAMK